MKSKDGNGTRTRRSRGRYDARVRQVRRFVEQPLRPGDQSIKIKGRLIIIGGHEDKIRGKLILRALADAAGSGKLVIATLASEQPSELWEEYERLLRDLGVRHISHLSIEGRMDAHAPKAMGVLQDATTVFFTGGDQLRLTSLLGDTPVFSRCLEIFANGGTIAGTSAGAAAISEYMLVSGTAEESHRIGSSLLLAPGFGFLKDAVVDQHFAERGRIGRLLGIVAQNPRLLGVGIDENTAIDVTANRQFQVMGEGAVYVVDGSKVTHTNVAQEEKERATSIFDICLHVLTQSDVFDLHTRRPESRPADEVEKRLGDGDGEESGKDAEGSKGRSNARAKNR